MELTNGEDHVILAGLV